MNRATLAIAPMIILTACSGLQPVVPPQRPSEDEITASYSVFSQKFGNLAPSAYVKMGYRKVDANCDLFFDQLAQAGRSYDFTKRETVLALSTASTILALLHNSATTLALLAAGGALLTSSIDNMEDYALLTHYTTQLKTYVDQARITYKQSNDPSLVGQDEFAADDFVRQYANICTIAGLEQTIAQSINNSIAIPGDLATQQLAKAANDVQSDLGGTLPTVDDLRALVKLLDPSATASRRQVTTSGGKFANAAGKYWDTTRYGLRPLGITRQVEINTALSLIPAPPPPGSSSAAVPAPPPPPPPGSPAPAPAPPPPPSTPAAKPYATPLINVPKS